MTVHSQNRMCNWNFLYATQTAKLLHSCDKHVRLDYSIALINTPTQADMRVPFAAGLHRSAPLPAGLVLC